MLKRLKNLQNNFNFFLILKKNSPLLIINMGQDDQDEENAFDVEEVQKIVRDNIELCLGGNIYSHSRSPQWISNITEKTITRLNKLNKPFKYILRVTITQKNGSGLHTAAAYFWDTNTDGTCTVRWENKYMYCIVNVWALALQL